MTACCAAIGKQNAEVQSKQMKLKKCLTRGAPCVCKRWSERKIMQCGAARETRCSRERSWSLSLVGSQDKRDKTRIYCRCCKKRNNLWRLKIFIKRRVHLLLLCSAAEWCRCRDCRTAERFHCIKFNAFAFERSRAHSHWRSRCTRSHTMHHRARCIHATPR